MSWAEEVPGGFTEASFTVPNIHALYDPQDFRYYTLVWLFDGAEPCFYGHIIRAVPQANGDIQVSLDGAYRRLAETRMRVAWSDQDLSQWQASDLNVSASQVSINSNGRLHLGIPKGTQVAIGDNVHVDYYLFDEGAGPRDGKLVTGLAFEQAAINLGGGFEFRILGRDGPGDNQPDTLFTASPNNPISQSLVSDGSAGDDANGWPSQVGYRCISIGIWATSAGTTTDDRAVSFSTLRVSSTARRTKNLAQHETSMLVQDLWDGAGNGYDIHHLLQEEYQGTTGEAVVGAIDASGQFVSGVTFPDWTAPQEIVETLSDTDGRVLGMWFPTRRYRKGSHVVNTGTTKNYWYRQPPELVHRDWSPLSDPDYIIRTQRGASWEPDTQGDELTEATYANYSTRSGRSVSVFVEDLSDDNYLYQQGWHEASDWQIDPPVGDQTAATLASRYNASKRQPTLSGTLTITGETIGAILEAGGGRVSKLCTIHAGSVVWVVDAKGHRRGRVTRVEYTGTTGDQPDQVRLFINGGRDARLNRRLARLALRAEQQRSR